MVTEKQFIQACKREGYSDEIVQKALKSHWLDGATYSFTDSGEIDLPKQDWTNALSDACGQPVSKWMWD